MKWSEPSGMSGLADDLDMVKSWCHLTDDNSTTDADVADMIRHAMRIVERHQKRQLLSATYTAYLEDWPDDGVIVFRDKLPITAVSAVKYKDDTDGTLQTVTSTNYHTSLASYHSPARIVPISGYTWPTLQTGGVERVQVTVTAGYGNAAQIPMTTRAAIRWLVSHMVENREPVVMSSVSELPLTVKAAMDADCWGWYG